MKDKKKILLLFLPIITFGLAPLLGILVLPLITREIPPEIYGEYNYYIILVNFIIIITFIPSINSSILRYLNKTFKEYSSDKVKLLNLIIFSVLGFMIISFVLSFFVDNILLFIYTSITYLMINLVNFYKSFLRTNGDTIEFSKINILSVLSQYIILFLGIISGIFNVYFLILGLFLFNLFYLIFLFYRSRLNSQFRYIKFDKQKYEKLMQFIIPGIGIALSGLILSLGDRIIIKNFLDEGEKYLGIFSVNYLVYSQSIEMLTTIFFLYIPTLLYPIFEHKGTNTYLIILKKLIELYVIIAGLISVILIFNYDKINYLLFDKSYYIDSKISLYILLGQFYFGLYRIISNYFAVTNKLKKVNNALFVMAVVNIILNIIFVPLFGFVAAALTTFLCYFLLFILIYIKVKSETNSNTISWVTFTIVLMLPLLTFLVSKPADYNALLDNEDIILELIVSSIIIIIVFGLLFFKRIKKIFKTIVRERA